jgi:transposase
MYKAEPKREAGWITLDVSTNTRRCALMTLTAVGVDLAKAKFDAAALRDGKYQSKVFPNTPAGFAQFQQWLAAFAEPHVCLEATGSYGEALATFLFEQRVPVSVVNPLQIHAFGQAELSRTKTDKGDARLIARFCQTQRPPCWQPPPAAVRQLQALVRRLDDLLTLQQMERNRQAVADATVQPSLKTVLDTLDAEINSIRRRIRDHINGDPDLRQRRDLLETIPGIGEATSAVLLGCLGDIQRFDDAKQVAAFAGLCPAERQSGTFHGQAHLSKTGDPLLRKALYLPAVVAGQHNPLLRAFRDRLKAKGKPGKVIVCAIMRKLLTLAYGVLKSGQRFDPNFALAT